MKQLTNEEFLRAIFPEPGAETGYPYTTSFTPPPDQAGEVEWKGTPWRTFGKLARSRSLQDPTRNNYFAVSTFKPNGAGIVKRRQEQFVAQQLVVLDDVGGGVSAKVAGEQIKLLASYAIETSPGNYHIGYLLWEPITDAREAQAVYGRLNRLEVQRHTESIRGSAVAGNHFQPSARCYWPSSVTPSPATNGSKGV